MTENSPSEDEGKDKVKEGSSDNESKTNRNFNMAMIKGMDCSDDNKKQVLNHLKDNQDKKAW